MMNGEILKELSDIKQEINEFQDAYSKEVKTIHDRLDRLDVLLNKILKGSNNG